MKDFFGISWGWLSAILICVSGAPYMWAIYKRKLARPVVSTWILWFGISLLLFATNKDAGATWETTLPAMLMGVINPLIIVCLSIRYGEYKWGRLDSACMLLCILTIAGWQATDSAMLGIWGAILADATAAAPQFVKSWKDPHDEPIFPWAVFAFASALNMLAVEKWVVEFWLYPVYMTLGSLLLLTPLVLYRLKARYA